VGGQSNIHKKQCLLQTMGANLEKEKRAILTEAKRLVDCSFNPANVTHQGNALQYGRQILRAYDRHRSDADDIRQDLADSVQELHALNEKHTRAVALVCTEQREAAQRDMREAEDAVKRANPTLLTDPDSSMQALQWYKAAKNELERLAKKEREAHGACGNNAGPSSN
jgi:hypothetical protein